MEQQNFRREVCATAKPVFATSALPGAVRTYEARLRASAPRFTAKLGSQVLPMSPGDLFFASFVVIAILIPRAASSVSAQPAISWSYVKLVKAAVAYWRVARGLRAVFDAEGSARIRVFWPGIERSRGHGKSPRLPPDVRAAFSRTPPSSCKKC